MKENKITNNKMIGRMNVLVVLTLLIFVSMMQIDPVFAGTHASNQVLGGNFTVTDYEFPSDLIVNQTLTINNGNLNMNNNPILNIDWSTSDDGPGSLLDADTLDGSNSSDLMAAGTDNWIDESGETTGPLTSDLNIDSDTLVVSYDDNLVGIGTNNPSVGLDIESAHPQLNLGTINQAGSMRFVRSSDGGAAAYVGYRNATDSANLDVFSQGGGAVLNLGGQDSIVFRTGNSLEPAVERITIDSGGRVGIGDTSPTKTLDVDGSFRITGGTIFDTGNLSTYFSYSNGGGTNYRNYFAPRLGDNSNWDWSNEFGFSRTYDAWYFDGNVGIGTENPSYKLDVSGTGRFTGDLDTDTAMNIGLGASSNTNAYIFDVDQTFTNVGGHSNARFEPTYSYTLGASRWDHGLYVYSIADDVVENGFNYDLRGVFVGSYITEGSTANEVLGTLALADSQHTTGTVDNVWGTYSLGINDAGGTTSTVRGVYGLARNDEGTVTSARGGEFRAYANVAGGTITNAYGVYSRVYEAAGSITTGRAFHAECDNATTCYGLYIAGADPEVTTAWGIYETGADKNYFSGNVGIGDTTPSYPLDVSGNGGFTSLLVYDDVYVDDIDGDGSSINFGGNDLITYVYSTYANITQNLKAYEVIIEGNAKTINFEGTGGPNGITFADDDTNGGQLVWRSSPNQLVFEDKGTGVDLFSVDVDVDRVLVGAGTAQRALHVMGNIEMSSFQAAGSDGMCWDGSGTSVIGDCSSAGRYKPEEFRKEINFTKEQYMQLNPLEYRWNMTKLNVTAEDFTEYGFIAEEVAAIDPLLARYRTEFNNQTGENVTYASDYRHRGITAVNTLMIQRLIVQEEELESKISENNKQLNDIIARVESVSQSME